MAVIEFLKALFSLLIHTVKEFLDMLNTDGGHIALTIGLLCMGIYFLLRWQLPEGKELFIFAMGLLAKVMNSTGKANGKGELK